MSDLLTSWESAEFLGISETALRLRRMRGTAPAHELVDGRIHYRLDVLVEYQRARAAVRAEQRRQASAQRRRDQRAAARSAA